MSLLNYVAMETDCSTASLNTPAVIDHPTLFHLKELGAKITL